MSCFCLDNFDIAQNKKQRYAIYSAVLLLHCLFFCLLSLDARLKVPQKKPSKLAVRTVVLSPASTKTTSYTPETLIAAAPEPVERIEKPIAEPAPKPAPKPVVKQNPQPKPVAKPTPKPVAKKPPTTKPKPQPQKQDSAKIERERLAKKQQAEAEAKQNALVEQALASINRATKVDQKKAKATGSSKSVTSAKTSQIGTLSSESLVAISSSEEVLTGREKTYYDELVQRLKLHLKLPDYGDVKVRLTINRSGKVLKVECTNSKSQKNTNYLNKVLPTLSFPSFGQNFPNEKEHTFFLHFSNDFNY